MTHRLVLGVDPGQSGAVAALADGRFDSFIDMPVVPRLSGGLQIDGGGLARKVRDVIARHAGAYVVVVKEQVNGMPSLPGKSGERRQMGATSAFNFGQSDGKIQCVFEVLGIPMVLVTPAKWKGRLGLVGKAKDCARTLAIQQFPAAAEQLQRKKDVGRADALLIAHWAELTEAVGPTRTAA